MTNSSTATHVTHTSRRDSVQPLGFAFSDKRDCQSCKELTGQVWTGIPPAGSRRRHTTMEKHVVVDLLNEKVRHAVSRVVLFFLLQACSLSWSLLRYHALTDWKLAHPS